MITPYIKNLITVNKTSKETINALEVLVADMKIENDKDKANFGNLCLILKSNRIIADATEAMLINENVLRGKNGEFYSKVDLEEEQPEVHQESEHKDE